MRSECYMLLIPEIVRNFNIEDDTLHWIYLSSVVEINIKLKSYKILWIVLNLLVTMANLYSA